MKGDLIVMIAKVRWVYHKKKKMNIESVMQKLERRLTRHITVSVLIPSDRQLLRALVVNPAIFCYGRLFYKLERKLFVK